MEDVVMPDSQIEADHFDEINKVDTSQTTNGSTGPSTSSSEQSASTNAISSDQSCSTNLTASYGTNNLQRATDLLFGISMYSEETKAEIINCARSAMDELTKIATAAKPLWQAQKENNSYDTLNDIEYVRRFGQADTTLKEIMKLVEVGEPQSLPSFDAYQSQHTTSMKAPRPALQVEGTRDMACVNMSPKNIVDLLMDVNQWSRVFHNIVSRAAILETFSDVVEGSYDGTLHVMSAELHLPTPLVPTRECYFARYSKEVFDQKWVVVDVSLEKLFPSPSNNFHKRPSGVMISGMPNGYSKVIWVEHVEADHSQLHDLFKPVIASGSGFGARRWLASLIRHIKWSETLTTSVLFSEKGVRIPQPGRATLLKLTDRMMRSFCGNVSATASNPWMQMTSFPGCENVRVMIKNNPEGIPMSGRTTVVFTTSLRLEVSPKRLFTFLRHEDSRNKWDMLSQDLSIIQFAYIIKGENPGNRASLLRAMTPRGRTDIFYVQESYTDSSCSYVIYAPLDEWALQGIANGCNPDIVIVLPSGFSILPAGQDHEGKDNASLLTIAFNIIDNDATESNIPPQSVETYYGIITNTVTSIKDAVQYHNELKNWIED